MAEKTPAQLDRNIAALDPSIRRMKAAGAEEALTGLARVARGQSPPPRPDYTAERTRLIGMLSQLTELETLAQSDAAKTVRAQFALQNTLLSTIGKIVSSELGAQGTVLAAKINYFEQRAKALDEDIFKYGPLDVTRLGEGPRTSIGKLGGYIKDGDVKPGNEAAFANEVSRTLDTLKQEPRLVDVFVSELATQYNFDLGKWFNGKQKDANIAPTANSVIPVLIRAKEAQAKSQEVVVAAREEQAANAREMMNVPGVDPGGVLGRAVKAYVGELGIGVEGLGTSGLPAKPGETAAPAPGMAAPAGGETATKATKTEGLRPYLNEQRDLILKELDRLENAEDPESVRIRQKIMASPALAQWASENGYADYRPDQQFKAALAYRRKALREQDAAFNAQLESDILAGQAGTALGRTGVKIKRFLTGETARRDRIEEGLAEAHRRRREKAEEAAPASGTESASLVGGSAGPSDKAPNVSESAPTLAENPKKAIETAMAEEPTISFDEGGVFEERGEAPTAERYGPGIRFATARARNEVTVQTYLQKTRDPAKFAEYTYETDPEKKRAAYVAWEQSIAEKNPEIVKAYQDAQAYKQSDPMKYAATLQELADKITARPPMGQITGVGDQEYLARDWRAQRRPTPEEAEPEALPAPEDEVPAEEMTAPAPEAPPVSPVKPKVPGRIEEVPMAADEDVKPPEESGVDERTPQDADFYARLNKVGSFQATPTTTTTAPASPDAAEPSKMATAAKVGSSLAKGMSEIAKPPMFESFGAEAATAAAGDAMLAYRQLEEETRRRRAALLRGGIGAV